MWAYDCAETCHQDSGGALGLSGRVVVSERSLDRGPDETERAAIKEIELRGQGGCCANRVKRSLPLSPEGLIPWGGVLARRSGSLGFPIAFVLSCDPRAVDQKVQRGTLTAIRQVNIKGYLAAAKGAAIWFRPVQTDQLKQVYDKTSPLPRRHVEQDL